MILIHSLGQARELAINALAFDPDEVLLRAFDLATDELKGLAVEYLRAQKDDRKLEAYLRARAVFVVAARRVHASAAGRSADPALRAISLRRALAAQRRAALGPETYLLAERNLDPFSRRCRVVAGKLRSTRRIRDYTRFVEETDYTQLKDKTD